MGWMVSPSAAEYDQIRVFVSEYSQDEFGKYILTPTEFEELEATFAMQIPPEELQQAERWKEQFDIHWPNINAFQDSIATISENRVIDKEETRHICFVLDQWITQMTAARDYVQEYREVDSETVEKNPGLATLEQEAERALQLLTQLECK